MKLTQFGWNDLSSEEANSLHVIGKCEECKHWQKLEQCDSQDIPFDIYANPDIPANFGCIHWEKKDV